MPSGLRRYALQLRSYALTLTADCVAGLFHAAISQSGSALNPRSSVTSEQAQDRARRLAKLVGVEASNDLDLVTRLRQVRPQPR